MKKTILLATLAASLVSVAKTTGSVEFFNENTGSFNKGEKGVYKVDKAGVKTEVKVDGTGLSFGGEFKVEGVKIAPREQNEKLHLAHNFFNNSNVFVKYELPQIKGVNSYVKGTLNPKVDDKKDDLEFKKGNAKLEADVNYEVMKDVKVGLNSKTVFPFENPADNQGFIKEDTTKTKWEKDQLNYGSKVTSTHKLYVKAFEDEKNEKGYKLRNVNADITVQHTYSMNENIKKQAHDPNAADIAKSDAMSINKSLKYISLSADATYAAMKDLDVYGNFRFKYQFNDGINYKDQYLGDKDLIEGLTESMTLNADSKIYEVPLRYIHAYKIGATYKGFANTVIDVNGWVNHEHMDGETLFGQTLIADALSMDLVNYGVSAKVEYKGVENLTLTGKTTLSGLSLIGHKQDSSEAKHIGIFNFAAGAKYDYKVNDKFTVSPEVNGDVKFFATKGAVEGTVLTLAPKVSAEYKPIEDLTVGGSIAVPVTFAGTPDDFNYLNTSVKTALNIKYEWK